MKSLLLLGGFLLLQCRANYVFKGVYLQGEKITKQSLEKEDFEKTCVLCKASSIIEDW